MKSLLGLLTMTIFLSGCGVEVSPGSKPKDEKLPLMEKDLFYALRDQGLKCQFTSRYDNAPVIMKMTERNSKNIIDVYQYRSESETAIFSPVFDGYRILTFQVKDISETTMTAEGLATSNDGQIDKATLVLNKNRDGSIDKAVWYGSFYGPAAAYISISDCRQYAGKLPN